jgi:hypothetical protein
VRLVARERPARKRWKRNAQYTARCLFALTQCQLTRSFSAIARDSPQRRSRKSEDIARNKEAENGRTVILPSAVVRVAL